MKIALWMWFLIVGLACAVLGFWGSCQITSGFRHTIWVTNVVTNYVASTNDVSVTNVYAVTNVKKVVITNDQRVSWSLTNSWTNVVRRVTTNG